MTDPASAAAELIENLLLLLRSRLSGGRSTSCMIVSVRVRNGLWPAVRTIAL